MVYTKARIYLTFWIEQLNKSKFKIMHLYCENSIKMAIVMTYEIL